MYKRVLVTGSIAYDHIMSMPGQFKDHIMADKIHILNVSFIMNTFRKEFGGTGGNIAYSLALLKVPTLLVGPAGYDFPEYRKHLAENKYLDISGVKTYKNESSAIGFVITDRSDNQIWGFYQGAMKFASRLAIGKYLKTGDFVVIAPNDPKAVMNIVKECVSVGYDYMFDPAFNIPHYSIKDMLFAIRNCKILIGNDYEIELIARRLGKNKKEIIRKSQILITTLGEKGSEIISDGKVIRIPPARPKNAIDPTGAGDAFRSGFLAGYIRNLSIETCGKMGSLSAVYTVEKYGTQTHLFSPKEFTTRFKQNFKQVLKL